MRCTDGDWGVHDEESMRSALLAAGQNPNTLCLGGSLSFQTEVGDTGPEEKQGSKPEFCTNPVGSWANTCIHSPGSSTCRCDFY